MSVISPVEYLLSETPTRNYKDIYVSMKLFHVSRARGSLFSYLVRNSVYSVEGVNNFFYSGSAFPIDSNTFQPNFDASLNLIEAIWG